MIQCKDVDDVFLDHEDAIAVSGKRITAAHFIDNYRDTDEKQFNYALYDIGMAIREQLVDSTIANYVLTSITDTIGRDLELYQLLDDNPSVEEYFRTQLALRTENDTSTFDYKQWIAGNLDYDTVYVPKIYVPNYGMPNIDPDSTANVAIGLEINENTYPNRPDQIMNFVYSGQSFVMTSISETAAYNSNNPVFILTNGFHDDAADCLCPALAPNYQRGYSSGGGGSKADPPNSMTDYHQESFKMNFAFEKGNVSEYHAAIFDYRGVYPIAHIYEEKVDDNDIGTNITRWQELTAYSSAMANNNVDLATYEYDWYASLKFIGLVSPQGDPNSIEGWYSRRTYKDEVYYGDGVPGYQWFNKLPSNSSTYTETTSNGSIKLWRID
jgi:hypothetical protein